MLNIIENLYWLLNTIMRLSAMHSIYLPPRDTAEYSNLQLNNYLYSTVNALESISENSLLWHNAIDIIKNLSTYEKKSNDRSDYLRELKKRNIENNNDVAPYQYAEAIINLCYNYACESSICNISKHYSVKEIIENHIIDEKTSYFWDFRSRLSEYWQDGKNAGIRFLTEETNEFCEFPQIGSKRQIINDICKNMTTAVRIAEYTKRIDKLPTNKVGRYEYDAKRTQLKHKNNIVKSLCIKFITIVLFLCIACFVELLTDNLQNVIGDKIGGGIIAAIITLSLLFLTEILTSALQNKYSGFMTLSDALEGFVYFCKDMWMIVNSKSELHFNESTIGISDSELFQEGTPILYVKTKAIKEYLSLYKKEKNSKLFYLLNEYPICDVEKPDTIKEMLRNEELYSRNYGIVYKSPYNTLIVDPIKKEGGCYSYERIMPTTKQDGVVIIVRQNNKLVLLNQSRHALRKKQYCFARGYSETSHPIEDVKRELKEELRIENKDYISEPKYIGQIAPDSGLSTTEAKVYLVDISHFSPNISHEGINDVIKISEDEFKEWVTNNRIDDGFTIAAFLLYKAKMEAIC